MEPIKNKLYKIIRHQANFSEKELGTYSSYEKAKEAIEELVTPFYRGNYFRFDHLGFFEIEEYPIDLEPLDKRNNTKIRSIYFDFDGIFISEYVIDENKRNHLSFGHIDCGRCLEVFETDKGEITVWDDETRGQEIYTSLGLLPFEFQVHYNPEEPFEPFVHFHDRSPLSDEQVRAVMDVLKGPCNNELFATNWDYALMRWNYKLIEGVCAHINFRAMRKVYKLPDTEELIKVCHYAKLHSEEY